MSKKSKSKTKPWAPAQPYLLGAANTIQNTVNSHQPQLDALSSDVSGHLPAMWDQAGDMSALQPGLDYTSDVLGGKFLNSNPYTTALTQQAGNDAANHVNSTFSMAGRTGSNNHATQLAKGVDQAENNVLFQNYQNERGQQAAAAGMLPSLNASRFAGYQPALAGTQLAGQLPFYGVGNLSAIGSMFSPYSTTTQSQGAGTMLGGILGAGLSGWAGGGFKGI